MNDNSRTKFALNSALRVEFATEPGPTFAVATGNVTAVNPVHYAGLEGQKPQLHPLLDATLSPTYLVGGTPLVGASHNAITNAAATGTEGSEPASNVAFSLTAGPTQTPASINAKALVSRQVYDAASTSDVMAELVRLVKNAYFDVVEGRVATALAAATLTEITLTHDAADAVLEADLVAASSALDVIRGGPEMTVSVAGPGLYGSMTGAIGSDNHPIGNYTAGVGVELAGRGWRPSWALTAASGNTGYIMAPDAAVTRIAQPQIREVQYQIDTVELHLFGYSVTSVVRPGDARRVVFAAS